MDTSLNTESSDNLEIKTQNDAAEAVKLAAAETLHSDITINKGVNHNISNTPAHLLKYTGINGASLSTSSTSAVHASNTASLSSSSTMINVNPWDKPGFDKLSLKQQQIQLTDCTYFLMGNCMRGSSCYYRHCEATLLKTENDICPVWVREQFCTDKNCDLRHPRPEHVGPGKYNQMKLAKKLVTGQITQEDFDKTIANPGLKHRKILSNGTTLKNGVEDASITEKKKVSRNNSNETSEEDKNRFKWKAGQTVLTGKTKPNQHAVNENVLAQNKISLNWPGVGV